MELQNTAGGAMRSQQDTGGAHEQRGGAARRRSHEGPGRRSHDGPGGARRRSRNQEEPGGTMGELGEARRSQS